MDEISQQTSSHMIVTIGSHLLQACTDDSGKLIMNVDRHWQCEPQDALSRLEDSVYEEPSLFEDIDTAVLIRPRMTVVAPASLVENDSQEVKSILDQYDLSESKDCFAETIGDVDDNMLLYSLPTGMRDFIGRCFPTEDIGHALKPFIKHFAPVAARELGDKMWVDVADSYADVIAFRDGRLLLANSWHYRDDSDLIYYLIYAWRTLGLDSDAGQMLISGKSHLRIPLMTTLRKYINYVAMPVMSRDLKNAVSEGASLSSALKYDSRKKE